MCSLRLWRAGSLLVTVFLVASILAGCGAGPSTAALLDPPPLASPSPMPASDDRDLGRQLFTGQLAVPGFVACIGCHSVDPAGRAGIGPNLAAIGQVAGQRVPGMSAAEYIERSIRFHDEFVVPGYGPGIARGAMGGREFNEVLSDAQVLALVAYLMSLPAGPSGANPTSGVAVALSSPPSGAATPRVTASATTTPTASATSIPTPDGSPTSPGSATSGAATTPTASATSIPTPSASPSPTASATSGAAATPTASVTLAATSTSTASPTPVATPVATPTTPPSPTLPPSPTPAPAPTPTPVATPTAVAVAASPTSAPLPSAPDDPNLARYAGCVSCHNQHPQQVRMPHPLNPTCNECHRGSPNRIGCPSCHSMHAIDNKHEAIPDLACATCHK